MYMAVSANPFLVPNLVRGHGGYGGQGGRARAQGLRGTIPGAFWHKDRGNTLAQGSRPTPLAQGWRNTWAQGSRPTPLDKLV